MAASSDSSCYSQVFMIQMGEIEEAVCNGCADALAFCFHFDEDGSAHALYTSLSKGPSVSLLPHFSLTLSLSLSSSPSFSQYFSLLVSFLLLLLHAPLFCLITVFSRHREEQSSVHAIFYIKKSTCS